EVAISSLAGSVWSYGLTVMTLDSESSSPSSTLGKTSSPVSSMVEREAFNLKVVGSIPTSGVHFFEFYCYYFVNY
ncbi:hypothetical protein BB559_007263, partial [Furculomyces boomerangus]